MPCAKIRSVTESPAPAAVDTQASRKARGAFFTPEAITRYMTRWAVRTPDDTVLEPSVGDAAFLVAAVTRLRKLADDAGAPRVDGVEIHEQSALLARHRVEQAGGHPHLVVDDFFRLNPEPRYSVVIGNPPYIRYQDFAGPDRARARAAALRAGVSLSALASSWAAFTVHSALFLRPGGRLGLVLPAELLSVNYAAVVRRFLLERFRSVELVMFTDQVFPGAEADVVLLLADGFGEGPSGGLTIRQARDTASLPPVGEPLSWVPRDAADRWTGLLLEPGAAEPLQALRAAGAFSTLQRWGETTLGMVTGNNGYFALSPARVAELGLPRQDLVPLSPPGSAHLRGLELSDEAMTRLGAAGRSTWMFHPGGVPSPAARAYIDAGLRAGVDAAYKCRVRRPWYRVPLLRPADLLLTCMNADTPRLTTNAARAHHLNSVHGVYLRSDLRELGRELLPLASLTSITLLDAEVEGRSYGGGILKLEPREADRWAMPCPDHVRACAPALRAVRAPVARLLQEARLREAVALVDEALLVKPGLVTLADLQVVRAAHAALTDRRATRGRSGR